ncbi:MAG: glycoside hydrolase family 9 protein [Ignavibacteriaceae bacterium]|nr:glycoside hydrolase family 9 protein [Ignavibacteriaceae bacterium]
MKKIIVHLMFFTSSLFAQQIDSWIRINQLGYQQNSIKTAVLLSKQEIHPAKFILKDALTESAVDTFTNVINYCDVWSFKTISRLDFSGFKRDGAYFIDCEGIRSPIFRVSSDVYDGISDFLLNYMRQQRCGYNPFLKDSCHTHDGFIIYYPELDSSHIDVTGGWHDASDYLQYVTTSANAVYQMLFAWMKNPQAFRDFYSSNGDEGKNGIPDILDEAKWGIDWLMKMNPKKNFIFNQIADDRDHLGFRLPNHDSISYGKGLERPVYFATGKPQGILKYQNRSNGLASTTGKLSSAFALASFLFSKYYPDLSLLLLQKAIDAYEAGIQYPGVCQTAPCRAPYFYEEENYTDDMELAAIQLYMITNEKKYLLDAVNFGKQEPVTPWMGADTAKHYEWYPFVNLGHYWLAQEKNNPESEIFLSYFRKGIDKVFQRGKSNPFFTGIPFIWCSNNLIAALLTQCRLYFELTSDTTYSKMEAALFDWLFGCNPWGTSMLVGLPANGDYPSDPHSAFSHLYNYPLNGGLVDGPVYSTIFNNLIGITLHNPDEYSEFQNDYIVYHDDYGDYSTNEPTMDGTASLSYYFSELENQEEKIFPFAEYSHGAIIRTDTTSKIIHLIFSGHEFADGQPVIKRILNDQKIKASFFLTGDFIRKYPDLVKDLKNDGHYIGPHSDKHLLYADWLNRDSLLLTKEQFLEDLKQNYLALESLGIRKDESKYFLPPFEWYNRKIAEWCKEYGIHLINFTPGTTSNADYTIPSMGKVYQSSDVIYQNILTYEEKKGLKGNIMLFHIGTHPERTDKFFLKLDDLISELKRKGYEFKLFM